MGFYFQSHLEVAAGAGETFFPQTHLACHPSLAFPLPVTTGWLSYYWWGHTSLPGELDGVLRYWTELPQNQSLVVCCLHFIRQTYMQDN